MEATVGGAGSAPWAALPDRTITLPPHATQTLTFDVSRDLAPAGQGVTYGAVVLEQAHGTVIARVATLIYLTRVGPSKVVAPPPSVRPRPVEPAKGTAPVVSLGHAVGRPLAVLALAVALVALVGALIRSLYADVAGVTTRWLPNHTSCPGVSLGVAARRLVVKLASGPEAPERCAKGFTVAATAVAS